MFREHKIIIVDDQKQELDLLASTFWKEGVACKAIQYEQAYNQPLKGIRVAFFDVNLTSKSSTSADSYDYTKDSSLRDIFHELATALRQYIAIDNGPYLLVFWTKNECLIDNFKVFVDERKSDYELPTPIGISCIPKEQFLDTNQIKLYDRVCKIVEESSVHLLYDLEKKCTQAITNTINDIHEIIVDEGNSWQQPNNNLKVKFTDAFIEIAKSTIGSKHVKDNLSDGIVAGLNPMINFHMEQFAANETWNDLFNISNKKLKQNDLIDHKTKHKLNSVFHINTKSNKCERGAVYALDNSNISNYVENYEDWVTKLIAVKSTLDECDRKKISEIINKSQLIAVELSPACDYSQKKDRLLKFMLGIKISEIDESLLDKEKVPAYSFFPKIIFSQKHEDNVFQLIFNFNYTISLPKQEDNIGTLLFSMKKEYMDMLTTKYANHISRIGITEFR